MEESTIINGIEFSLLWFCRAGSGMFSTDRGKVLH
jgi:hypothetical protein